MTILHQLNSEVECLSERGPTSFGVVGAISARLSDRLSARLSAWLSAWTDHALIGLGQVTVPLACVGTECVQRVSSAFRLNSARTATAAASAAPGREPPAKMAGTAEAASGTATASVRLKAPRSLRGIFGIVSSASDRRAAEGKTD